MQVNTGLLLLNTSGILSEDEQILFLLIIGTNKAAYLTG